MTGSYIPMIRDVPVRGRRDPICPACDKPIEVGQKYWYHMVSMECYHQECFEPESDKIFKEE